MRSTRPPIQHIRQTACTVAAQAPTARWEGRGRGSQAGPARVQSAQVSMGRASGIFGQDQLRVWSGQRLTPPVARSSAPSPSRNRSRRASSGLNAECLPACSGRSQLIFHSTMPARTAIEERVKHGPNAGCQSLKVRARHDARCDAEFEQAAPEADRPNTKISAPRPQSIRGEARRRAGEANRISTPQPRDTQACAVKGKPGRRSEPASAGREGRCMNSLGDGDESRSPSGCPTKIGGEGRPKHRDAVPFQFKE